MLAVRKRAMIISTRQHDMADCSLAVT